MNTPLLDRTEQFSSTILLIVCLGVLLSIPRVSSAQVNIGDRLFRGYEIDRRSRGNTWDWFPSKLIYPAYLADPRRAKFAFQRLNVNDPEIPRTGNSRFHLSAGNRFGILRYGRWQFDVHAGAFLDFDIDNSQDNIGWDGIFGWMLTRHLGQSTAVKFEFKHQSSHRGDEFIERTGLTRIDYTRAELNLGISQFITPRFRIYGEGGWATQTNNERVQGDGRLQGGIEYTQPFPIWNNPTGFYLAGDFQAFEGTDWDLTSTVQTGMFLMQPDATWRFGIEYRSGQPTIGEFIQNDEQYIGWGIWIDFFDPRNIY